MRGIEYYIGKNIIGWLHYNEFFEMNNDKMNNRCYVYPRVINKEGEYELIDPSDFPELGRIEIRVQGGVSSEEVVRKYGQLVQIKINIKPFANIGSNNAYSLKYYDKLGKNESEIWIGPFNGKGFYQVIDVNENIEDLMQKKSIRKPKRGIFTTAVFLRSRDMLYGPFKFDIRENEILLMGSKEHNYEIGEYCAIDYNDDLCIITDNENEEVAIFLSKKSIDLFENENGIYDWISEDKLIEGLVTALSLDKSYSRDQMLELKENLSAVLKKGASIQFSQERIERLETLVSETSCLYNYIDMIVRYVLNHEDLENIVVDNLLKNHFDEIEEMLKESQEMKRHFSRLKSEEATLQQQLNMLKEACVSLQPVQNEEVISQMKKEIETLKERNVELKELVDSKEIHDELKNGIEEEKIKLEELKNDYKKQVIDNEKLKVELEDTIKRFGDSAAAITAKILDDKLLNKILSSVNFEKEDDIEIFNSDLLAEEHSYQEIILRVGDFIRNKAHRSVSDNEVINYLICITQGFITTFAGEPGTGKTSLCSILAKAFGLQRNDQQNRFLELSVERGWTSHKDYIGYYNPLTKTMERSNNEAFSAFVLLDREHQQKSLDIAPFFVLLDEANLSPIEHYWAAFLKICDFSSSEARKISMGGNEMFGIPNHLRFLATVNFDHTTEELSPRFLDRSWIICLDPVRIDEDFDEDVDNYSNMISYKSMWEAFSVKEDDVIDEVVLEKWDAIQAIFRNEKCMMPIMPRNLKMIRNYCKVACRCMDMDTPATKLAPLDYAFSQKILPTINGAGERYNFLIEELLKECTEENMPRTNKHLVRMQKNAENNMGFYQFFGR